MAIITLTTDFGSTTGYVAQMKAVLLRRSPDSVLVDITHDVPPQNTTAAAIWLADTLPWFPSGSVHLAVIDPGVGTSRKILVGRFECPNQSGINDQHFIVGPDNGLFSLLNIVDAWHLDETAMRTVRNVSNTFHGRDLMAPAAAAIAGGIPLSELGERRIDPVRFPLPKPEHRSDAPAGSTEIRGKVLYADSFGNLITNIHSADYPSGHTITEAWIDCPKESTPILARPVATYGDATPGELVVLWGSGGRVEFAVCNGNAAERLALDVYGADSRSLPSLTLRLDDSTDRRDAP
ncbi:SAM hydrolase/SAM-dependent halogenase family protein [Crateriforma conspicua]|uniref:SAM hydrolase/SAM-dependent halogenase family protein n=1 Tax=Crateriforma conspicua TaxID=2527996 RepID=UPI00118864AC|nr:SAM-dependent chlorinase/fluorinase [Crateriforma conspicua]QDV64579.1 Adenosyl-chloride synthase [Crateriforma conspicua]